MTEPIMSTDAWLRQNTANDLCFWNALNSYNSRAAQTDSTAAQMQYYAAAQQAAAAQQGGASADSTRVSKPAVTDEDLAELAKSNNIQLGSSSPSSVGTYLGAGTIIATGVGILIYAGHRGNGEGVKAGFKNIWKGIRGWFGKKAETTACENSERATNILRRGGRNIEESILTTSDGAQIVFRNGKPVRLSASRVSRNITEPDAVAGWSRRHSDIADQVRGRMPQVIRTEDGSILSYVETKLGDHSYQFTFRDGNPVQIAENMGGSIRILRPDEALDISQKYSNEISSIIKNHTSILPDGVSLASWSREFSIGNDTYKFVVENGKTTKVLRLKADGTYQTLPEKEMAGFIRNHGTQVKEAETLERTFTTDSLKDILGDNTQITLQVRKGKKGNELLGAYYKNADGDIVMLSDKELKLVKDQFSKQIKTFGREHGSLYGLEDYEYFSTFRNGNLKAQIRFRENGDIIGIQQATKRNNLNGNGAVMGYLRRQENADLKAEVDVIEKALSEGTEIAIPEGWKVLGTSIKADSGNVFKVSGENVSEIILKEAVEIDGKKFTTLKGKDIQKWIDHSSDNKAEYEKILELMK